MELCKCRETFGFSHSPLALHWRLCRCERTGLQIFLSKNIGFRPNPGSVWSCILSLFTTLERVSKYTNDSSCFKEKRTPNPQAISPTTPYVMRIDSAGSPRGWLVLLMRTSWLQNQTSNVTFALPASYCLELCDLWTTGISRYSAEADTKTCRWYPSKGLSVCLRQDHSKKPCSAGQLVENIWLQFVLLENGVAGLKSKTRNREWKICPCAEKDSPTWKMSDSKREITRFFQEHHTHNVIWRVLQIVQCTKQTVSCRAAKLSTSRQANHHVSMFLPEEAIPERTSSFGFFLLLPRIRNAIEEVFPFSWRLLHPLICGLIPRDLSASRS